MEPVRIETLNILEKWGRNQDDKYWARLGKIFKERFILAKRELNYWLKNHDYTVSLKDRIAVSKCTTFDEIRKILNNSESNN